LSLKLIEVVLIKNKMEKIRRKFDFNSCKKKKKKKKRKKRRKKTKFRVIKLLTKR